MILTNYLKFHPEHKDLIIRARDIIENELSFSSFKILYFINPAQEKIIQDICNHYSNINCYFISYFINTEYHLAILSKNKIIINFDDYISLFTFKFNNKFITIRHQDILGALLNLNIQREYLGDIYIIENNAYFEVSKSLENYIFDNLSRINKVNLDLKVIHNNIEIIRYYQNEEMLINSLRLDNVVKGITNLSSNKTRELILSNVVKVNYLYQDNHSLIINVNDIISIKGYGKFIIDQYRLTKKAKYRVAYRKYK
ncbi:MAG: hypothetical protein LBR40_06020 [Bacilli bacterium]|jgi:RNA-binding protein YlmH|nr:hypothetical protein [Bacilli bacterium]